MFSDKWDRPAIRQAFCRKNPVLNGVAGLNPENVMMLEFKRTQGDYPLLMTERCTLLRLSEPPRFSWRVFYL